MLEMMLDDDMNEYMPWESCIWIRSMIFVNFGMMNIYDIIDEHLLYIMRSWWYEDVMLKSYIDS